MKLTEEKIQVVHIETVLNLEAPFYKRRGPSLRASVNYHTSTIAVRNLVTIPANRIYSEFKYIVCSSMLALLRREDKPSVHLN
jgi:hypothetical protein